MLPSMENYRLQERLGKGGQGSVYLAEHIEEKKNYVLKKIECCDESEANKAFREAMALQELQHPYICGYKNFFVLWDKEESSMFVCIVMDWYEHGDLSKLIREYRNEQKVIEEEMVKKWLGEILEALIFVHKKGIIHRDLKPSNVFLNEEKCLCLGDFGVATIMGDAKTCTRCQVGTMNYMAPEVASQPHDVKSDVWALGCILFELVTTSFLGNDEVQAKLKEIKEDPFKLEEVNEIVAKNYSGELISTIRAMLKVNSANRPDTDGLMEIPYVSQCVEMRDSAMLEKRKRQDSANVTMKSVPKDEGVLSVIEYIATMIDHEYCIKEALEYLLELSKQEEPDTPFILDDRGRRLVGVAMRNNMQDSAVQIAGLNLLHNLILTADVADVLFSNEMIGVVPYAMSSHKQCLQIQQIGAALLMAMSTNETTVDLIGELDGIQDVLNALEEFGSNAELCSTCCGAIWSLAIIENNIQRTTRAGGLQKICKVLKEHISNFDVVENASAAILSLSLEDENFNYVGELDCVGLLVSALEKHMKNAKVVKNTCLALSSLVEPDEESAYRILTTESECGKDVSGIPMIMKAYGIHKDNADVVESIVTLFMELAEYDEICRDLLSFNAQKLLSDVKLKFMKYKNIMGPCESALLKLSLVSSSETQS